MQIDRIHLVPGRLHVASHGVIFQVRGTSIRVALPPEARAIIDEIQGRPGMTVRELVARMHTRDAAIGFRVIGATLERLADADAIVDGRGGSIAPLGPQPVVRRISGALAWRVPLSHGAGAAAAKSGARDPSASRAVPASFVLAAAVVLGGAALVLARGAWHPDAHFLRVQGSHARGLLLAVVAISALQTAKNVVKALLLFLARGRTPGGALVLSPLAVYIEVLDDDLYATASPLVAALYGAASVASIIAAAGTAGLLLSVGAGEQLGVLAFLLALWTLRPYGEGELARTARAFVRGDLGGAELPYLKTRALAGMLSGRKGSSAENRLIVFSSLAIAWTFVALHFVMRLVSLNVVGFERALSRATGGELVAVLLVIAGAWLAVGYVALDLVGTLLRNAASPFAGRLQRAWRTLRSRDDAGADRDVVRAVLAEVPLFQECSDAAVQLLAAQGTVRSYSAGSPIIVQGDLGQELYVLLDGAVQVSRTDEFGRSRPVARLEGKCVFGELAVLQETPRTAGVVADTPVRLLVLPGATFKALTRDPAHAKDFVGCVDRILLGQYLASAPGFAAVPKEVLSTLLARGEFVEYAAGSAVFEQGGAGDAFYLVLRGEMDIVIDGSSAATVGQGSFVGEMAILTSQPRNATVLARTGAKLLRVDVEGFWEIVSKHLEMAMFLEAVAEDRARLPRRPSEPAAAS